MQPSAQGATFKEWQAMTDIYRFGLGALHRGESGAAANLRRVGLALARIEAQAMASQLSLPPVFGSETGDTAAAATGWAACAQGNATPRSLSRSPWNP